MKDPIVSPIIAEIARLFGLDGVRVTWSDGRVWVNNGGRWVRQPNS